MLDNFRTNWFEMVYEWQTGPSDGGSRLTSFIVEYRKESALWEDENDGFISKDGSGNINPLSKSHSIFSLERCLNSDTPSNYEFRIKACNGKCCSEDWYYETINYCPDGPPDTVDPVEVVEETCCDRITVEWIKP